MKTLRSQLPWLVAMACGFIAVATAVTVADRPTIAPPVTARDVSELSTVFRNIAKGTTPAVVTIVTKGKARAATQFDDDGGEFGGDGLDDMLRNHPQFRDFFRQMPRQQRQIPRSRGLGTGFVIDASGIIVTNNHVVADAEEILVRFHDGREFKGRDVKTDPRTDVAILRIDAGEKLPTLRFGDSDSTEVGDWVVAVGSPFGQELTVTAGIISAKGRGPNITEREDFLQTDAAINPGNSGGPLLNINGDVIGINTAISSSSGGFDGIGFAVPSKMAYWVVNQLVQKGLVQRAFIGVAIQQLDSDLAAQFKLKPGEGALITEIRPNSPGEAAKLQIGDVVLSLNGQKVSSPRSLQGIVEQLSVDQPYPLELLRDGKRMTIDLSLKEMPKDYSLSQMRPGRAKPKTDENTASVDSFGFEIRDITDELAQKLELEKNSGVLVSSVDENGVAAGRLRTGDIIEMVGNVRVKSRAEFDAALKQTTTTDSLRLFVRSGGAARFVVIPKTVTK